MCMLEVGLTRLHTVMFGPEAAYALMALALLCFGIGAIAPAVIERLHRPEKGHARLVYLASGVAGAAAAGVIYVAYVSTMKPGSRLYLPLEAAVLDRQSALVWGTIALASAIPFTLAGIASSLVLRRAAEEPSESGAVGLFYFASLAGGAVGCLVAIETVRDAGPRAILFSSVIASLAAFAFWIGIRRSALSEEAAHQRGVAVGVAATLVLGTAVLVAGDIGAPWLKLNLREAAPDKADMARWSELGLVTVEKATAGVAWIRTDGRRTGSILDGKTAPPPLPEDMAYVLHRDKGPVLVLDAEGGRHVRAALKAGQKDIVAVVLHPVVANEVMREDQKKWSGDVYDRPEVLVIIDDGRGELRGAPPRAYRHIVLPAPADIVARWPYERAGSMILAEAQLHTREALAEHLGRLLPEGTIVVSRPVAELDRLLAMAASVLRAGGTASPKDHLYACETRDAATLLVKKAAITPAELRALRKHCTQQKFSEAFAPDQPRNEARKAIVAAEPGASPGPASTDDRPFPSFQPDAGATGLGRLVGFGPKIAAGSAVAAAAAALVALLLPMLLGRATPGRRGRDLRGLLFFCAAGSAAGAAELALIRQLSIFLEHPAYALTVIVPTLLVALGLGSLLAARVDPARASGRIVGSCVMACVLLAGLGITLRLGVSPPSLPWPMRIPVVLGLLAVLGMLLGSQVPLGAQVLASPRVASWGWGIYLVGRVVGITFGAVGAARLGYGAVLLLSGMALLLAAAAAPRPVRARPALAAPGASPPAAA